MILIIPILFTCLSIDLWAVSKEETIFDFEAVLADNFCKEFGLSKKVMQMDQEVPNRQLLQKVLDVNTLWLQGESALGQLYRFLAMLACCDGQIFDANQIGRSLNISRRTARKYLNAFVDAGVVILLEPWLANINKRQINSAKIYFCDSGILHTLLGINDVEQLYTHQKVAALWEAFALKEIIRRAGATSNECFFWHTKAWSKLDLFIIKSGKRIGFEFKYADTAQPTKLMQGALETLELDHLYIIIPISDYYLIADRISVCGFDNIDKIFPI